MFEKLASFRWIAILLMAVLVIQLIGCGGGGSQEITSSQSQPVELSEVDFIVQSSSENEPLLMTTDGSSMALNQLEIMSTELTKNRTELAFIVNDSAIDSANSRWVKQIGRYHCRIQWHSGWVGGCIKKTTKHLNLEI